MNTTQKQNHISLLVVFLVLILCFLHLILQDPELSDLVSVKHNFMHVSRP